MGAGDLPPRSLSLGRYVSEDMSSVGLDSPRGGHAKKSRSWPSDDEPAGLTASCVSLLGPFTNPVLGGETLSQVTTSWCIPSEVLLAWRMIMFIYMVGTCAYLGSRGSLLEYTLSAEIYVVQTVASLLVLIPWFLPRGGGAGGCFGRGLPRTNASFGRHRELSPVDEGGESCCSSTRQFLFTAATATLQSAAGLVAFWDLVFWMRLRPMVGRSVDVMLLHCYNVMPPAVELVFGQTEFRLLYFLPGTLFVGAYLAAAASGALVRSTAGGAQQVDWVQALFETSGAPGRDWVALMMVCVVMCVLVFAIQRVRRGVGRAVGAGRDDAAARLGRRGRARATTKPGPAPADRGGAPPAWDD
jgi:hypothetical protein